MDNRAIGVFDSGLGGLTAVRELHRSMPQENIIYFGDTGRVPYGTRGRDTLIKYTRQDIRFLLGFDLKAIVVACNTASTVLDVVRDDFSLPIFGTVEPSSDRARAVTKNGRVGVICTPATARSGVFERQLHRLEPTLSVMTVPCPLFVPMVENGRVHRGDIVIETLVREYLAPLKDAAVDTLVLACTHFPLLHEVIADFMGPQVRLVDSGAEAAGAVHRAVAPAEDGAGRTQYFVSDDPAGFAQLAGLFLQQPVDGGAELVDISAYKA